MLVRITGAGQRAHQELPAGDDHQLQKHAAAQRQREGRGAAPPARPEHSQAVERQAFKGELVQRLSVLFPGNLL
jgi:hypothetical protein